MKRTGEQGSSLVEVMVALGISLVLLLSVAGLFGLGLDQNYRAGHTTTELCLAQEKLEELLTTGDGPNALTAGTYQETLPDGFVRTWTIVANQPGPNARTIVVRAFRRNSTEAGRVRLVGVRAQ